MKTLHKIPFFETVLPETPICYIGKDTQTNSNEIYMKREDLLPFSFGGNKVRKAAEFYRDIQATSPDILMTYGTSSSNHCRVIANMAYALGIPCHLISPEAEETEEHFNCSLTKSFGAIIETCPVSQVSETILKRKQAYENKQKKVYFIQGGGHGNLGTEGYVKCYQEILCQQQTLGITFDYIFHASGTGSTQAGLVCGKLIHSKQEKRPEIIGISIARAASAGKSVIKESVISYLGDQFLELYDDASLIFTDQYTLGGYGKYNEQILNTVKSLMNNNGIYTDTTYVGKAFYGMQKYIQENKLTGKKILFIHTGSSPLYFDTLRKDYGKL